jgi:hypothetical protein
MPTPAGTISFSQIESEFGRNGSKSLGSYRISQSAGLYSDLPLDDGVPKSVAVGNSAISFSQLRDKRLNIVVDISGQTEYRVNMRSKYDSNIGVTVIGGFIGKPVDPSQKRIKVSVNETIGSDSGSINSVALRTGTWGTSANLEVLLGPSAAIIGAGGKGGDFTAEEYIVYETDEYGNVYENGTDFSYYADGGYSGSSALGIDYPTTLTNNGYIQNGFGGGGAGGFRVV